MQKYDGYPSGSMVDFACDVDGSPILAVSILAVHTKVCAVTFLNFKLFCHFLFAEMHLNLIL